MAYTQGQKAEIQFDYESGRMTTRQIGDKWKMSRTTLQKFAENEGWVLGKFNEELSHRIERTAADYLVKKESLKLVEMAEEHLLDVGVVDTALRLLLKFHIMGMKENEGLLTKSEVDMFKANYQAFDLLLTSFDKSFRSKRLAMGLKDTDPANFSMKVILNDLNKTQDYSSLSNDQLQLIIANETKKPDQGGSS